MKKYVLIVVLLVSALGFSQNQGAIKGTVLDTGMMNEPLLFANVQLKGADKKTETNFHGNFDFADLESGAYILVVSYAGYESIEIPVLIEADKITQVNLGMSAKTFDLSEVSGITSISKEKLITATALD